MWWLLGYNNDEQPELHSCSSCKSKSPEEARLRSHYEAMRILGDTTMDTRQLLGEDLYNQAEKTANRCGFGEEFLSTVLEKYHERRREPVEIAIVGAQGVGKSSLTNALRDLPHDAEDAAPVGVTETTLRERRYSHRAGKTDMYGVVYVDNPGREVSCLAKADVILVVSCTRLTPFDRELIVRCADMGKPWIFVRTKVDIDVMNERASKPSAWASGKITERIVLQRIKKEIYDTMAELFPGSPGREQRVFLVNNQTSVMSPYDLVELREHVAACLPLAKSLEFLRVAPLMSEEIIEEKRRILQDDIKVWTHLSALVFGAQPIPLLGSAGNWKLLSYWNEYLGGEFGVDDDTIKRLFDRLSFTGVHGDLLCHIKTMVSWTVAADCAEVGYMSGGAAVVPKAPYLLPGAGSAACGLASISLIRWAIRTMIDRYADFAKHVHSLIMEAIRLSELGFELRAGVNLEYAMVSTMNEVTLGTKGEPMHLVFEMVGDHRPGIGRLTTFNNRVLSLCWWRAGCGLDDSEHRSAAGHLCFCIPKHESFGNRQTFWRRHPVRRVDGSWWWCFEAAEPRGFYMAWIPESGLYMVELGNDVLEETHEAHFALVVPNIGIASRGSFTFDGAASFGDEEEDQYSSTMLVPPAAG